jgi:hypothetical protein
MSTRTRTKRSESTACEANAAGFNHVHKDFDEVAERIFRDDAAAEPLFGGLEDIEDPEA